MSHQTAPIVPMKAVKLPWGLAWRIAIGQIVAWGTLYYGFSVMVNPIENDTGWSRQFINSGLSVGLLVWGILAVPVGIWIQRNGGRGLMTWGSLAGGIALILMGSFVHPSIYMVSWIAIGASMATLLYEPAFSVITNAFRSDYRQGITLITLVAGLASTIFIPLANFMVENMGWDRAIAALGMVQIGVGVPLHYFGLPRLFNKVSNTSSIPPAWPESIRRWFAGLAEEIQSAKFVGLAIWFSAHAAAFSGLTFMLMPLHQSMQANMTTVIFAISLIGPMQVIGRLFHAKFGAQVPALLIGTWAMICIFIAVILLMMLPSTRIGLVMFALLYGSGNGVMTIVKGTIVAELFGIERYAEFNGLLAAPVVIAKAGSPLVLAILWSATNEPRLVLGSVLIMLLCGVLGLQLAQHDCKSNPTKET